MADSNISIVGLQAFGGVNQNVLQWAIDDPNIAGLSYLRFKQAEVRASLLPSMASPVTLSTRAFTAHAHLPIGRGEHWYYQARAINQSDQAGDWSAVVDATEISGEVLVAGNGYWRLPSGLIFQWGLGLILSGQNTQIAFPLRFPHGCLWVAGWPGAVDNTDDGGLIIPTWQTTKLMQILVTGFTDSIFGAVCREVKIHADGTTTIVDPTIGCSVYWFAIGS